MRKPQKQSAAASGTKRLPMPGHRGGRPLSLRLLSAEREAIQQKAGGRWGGVRTELSGLSAVRQFFGGSLVLLGDVLAVVLLEVVELVLIGVVLGVVEYLVVLISFELVDFLPEILRVFLLDAYLAFQLVDVLGGQGGVDILVGHVLHRGSQHRILLGILVRRHQIGVRDFLLLVLVAALQRRLLIIRLVRLVRLRLLFGREVRVRWRVRDFHHKYVFCSGLSNFSG